MDSLRKCKLFLKKVSLFSYENWLIKKESNLGNQKMLTKAYFYYSVITLVLECMYNVH